MGSKSFSKEIKGESVEGMSKKGGGRPKRLRGRDLKEEGKNATARG